jgi:hypothetical protein
MKNTVEEVFGLNDVVVSEVVNALLTNGAKTATAYLSPKHVVRASIRLIKGKLPPKHSKTVEVLVTIGAPNYAAREFIKTCKKAGEPFPVKKIQLKFPVKK